MANENPRSPESLSPAGRKERLTFTRPVAAPGTEILTAYDSLDPWRVFHEQYAICPCRTAAAGWRYRGENHFLRDGRVMLLEPGETHANTRVHKYSDFKVLFIERDLFVSAAQELGVSGTPHFRVAQSEDRELFSAVYGFSLAAEEKATALEQQSRLTVCLRRLLGYVERAPRAGKIWNGHRAVERARAYLHEHFEAAVSLNELVAASGLSRFHLLRVFSKELGLPPHAYQIRLRIERARTMLRKGMPPALVAGAAGFADQSHFTRHFKRVWGITPARYASAGH